MNLKMKTMLAIFIFAVAGPAISSPLPPQCHNPPLLPYPLTEEMLHAVCNLGCCDAAGIPLPGATEPPLRRPFMTNAEVEAKYPCIEARACTSKQKREITDQINSDLAWLRAEAGAIGAHEGARGEPKKKRQKPQAHPASQSKANRPGI